MEYECAKWKMYITFIFYYSIIFHHHLFLVEIVADISENHQEMFYIL